MAYGRSWTGWVVSVALAAAGFLLSMAGPASAGSLSQTDIERAFPDLDESVSSKSLPGPPPVIELRRDGALLGYVFSTDTVVGSVGYSGKPIDIAVGLKADGTLAGAHLISHNEPILVIGVPPERLSRFVAGFTGYDIRKNATSSTTVLPEVVSGASVSSAVIQDAIIRASRAVAAQKNLFGRPNTSLRIDRTSYSQASWQDLLHESAIVRRVITNRDVGDAIPNIVVTAGGSTDPEGIFIELFTGLATPPRIGQNLIGKRMFNRLVAEVGLTDSTILVAANGRYSFKGTGISQDRHVRAGSGSPGHAHHPVDAQTLSER